MVEAMSKAVSAMTMQGHPKSTKGTQYQGALNYVGSTNWHMVLMGHCSLVLPASIARTLDILRITVSS